MTTGRTARLVSRLLHQVGAGRSDPGADLARSVRAHDLRGDSDAQLKGRVSALGPSAQREPMAIVLPEVFAVVDEALSRRLGAWKLFDSDSKLSGLARCREAGDHILEASPHRDRLAYYIDDSFLDSPAFARSIEPALAETDLDQDERNVVTTMVYVAETSMTRYSSDILLPEHFYRSLAAIDRQRALSFRATDEQLQAGSHLFEGKVVEMNAGEGKTIAAAFPAVTHAVLGRRVHIITANDYLASRDAEWLAPVYETLGFSVSAVLSHMDDDERRAAYQAQIVYGTLKEFGFDYLRDNLKHSTDDMVQGPLEAAIVDEADQAMIDEAGTPLIIAGTPNTSRRSVHKINKAVEDLVSRQKVLVADLDRLHRQLDVDSSQRFEYLAAMYLAAMYLADSDIPTVAEAFACNPRLGRRVRAAADGSLSEEPHDTPAGPLYYIVDRGRELVTLTERGHAVLERSLGPIFDTGTLEGELAALRSSDAPLDERRRHADALNSRLSERYNQAHQLHTMLHARALLKRDVDYIVAGGRVVLIDRHTGRRRSDSRYQHGLQAAIEAREGVSVVPETVARAQTSVQGFLRLYSHVSGMSGTAQAIREELSRTYTLRVVSVPPSNRPRRTDFPARVYATRVDKLSAIVEQVSLSARLGRPVLVGTHTVEQSAEISILLKEQDIRHRLLNAVNNADEAQVVREAGNFGTVTVATNMAGRGTDILLEPGLDRRVTASYVSTVKELLSGGASHVSLSCATSEEAEIIESALARAGLSTLKSTGDDLRVLVEYPRHAARSERQQRSHLSPSQGEIERGFPDSLASGGTPSPEEAQNHNGSEQRHADSPERRQGSYLSPSQGETERGFPNSLASGGTPSPDKAQNHNSKEQRYTNSPERRQGSYLSPSQGETERGFPNSLPAGGTPSPEETQNHNSREQRHTDSPERQQRSFLSPSQGETERGFPTLEFGLGLYVIGTELHDSRRIDLQLRGRSGRQGDFGSSRLMLSLEDPSIAFGAGAARFPAAELGLDSAGRRFYEGRRTDSLLDDIQGAVETDGEVTRATAWDFNQAIEAQSLSFYRDRSKVMQSASFHQDCIRMAMDRGRRLIDAHLPPESMHQYAQRFDALAEELLADYHIDISELWGLGADSIVERVQEMMRARLEEATESVGASEFDSAASQLFLRTADELWEHHLARLHDLLSSTGLAAHGHKSAAADYLFRATDEYRRSSRDVTDTFLPRLVELAESAVQAPIDASVDMAPDVEKILV